MKRDIAIINIAHSRKKLFDAGWRYNSKHHPDYEIKALLIVVSQEDLKNKTMGVSNYPSVKMEEGDIIMDVDEFLKRYNKATSSVVTARLIDVASEYERDINVAIINCIDKLNLDELDK